MNPRDFTLHPNAQERAEAEAVWLNEWCEEIKMTFRYKALTSDAAWVIANIVVHKESQEDTEDSPWWGNYGRWWDELDRLMDTRAVKVEEKKRNGRWGRPRDL